MDEIFNNLHQEASAILKIAILNHLKTEDVTILSTHEKIGLDGCKEFVL